MSETPSSNPPPIRRQSKKQGPLSSSQESLWFLNQLDPSNLAYNSIYLFRLKGAVEPRLLERALNEIVRRHENLRTIYPNQGGQPLQVIRDHEPFMLTEQDFSSLPQEERDSAVRDYALAHGKVPFDLHAGPLTRFALLHAAPHEDYLFFATHHIGFDAWSRHVLIGELVQLYGVFRSGGDPGLPELPVQYLDYALWQRNWLSGDTLKTYVEHWKEFLFGDLPALDLPTDRPRPVMQTYQGARHFFTISPHKSARVKEFCQKERLTPFHLFLAAYSILLMRYTGLEDIITGCPFANRPLPEFDGVVGAFINTLPIRLYLGGNPSVRSLLQQVRAVMLDAFSWQAVPFETLVSEISLKRDLSRTPVFQVLINMRNVPRRQSAIEDLEVESVLREDASAAFDISFELGDEGDHFSAAVRYNTGLFDHTTILYMVSHYQNILQSMLEEPDQALSELEMLTPSERQRLVLDWNETQAEFPQQSIHELISGQAEKSPETPAVICNGRQLTYAGLERRANQLAGHLTANGVGSGTLVGLYLPRLEDLLVSQLAILKSGGACVPLDLTYPAERLAYMLQDANPAMVITLSSLSAQLPDRFRRICLDAEADAIRSFPDQRTAAVSDAESVLYVTYTSGTTGRPKGVITIQRGVQNYLHHLAKAFHLSAGERVLQFTPLSFDAAFRDTLGVLTFGGTVILLDDEQMRDPDFIRTAIVDQQVNCILSVVPTMLRAVSQSASSRGTGENCLRLIMPSGEALLAADVDLVTEAFGAGVEIVNQYGPTECSMISTLYRVSKTLPDDPRGLPIGKPIANARAYVLDRHLHPVPVGVNGELYIGGLGVGRGYLNQPELTAQRFVPDPFHSGERMYRSGDLVRYSREGTLSYLGRLDQQVKIRGYRVELGEIESVARECPGVREAAVVLWPDRSPEVLALYVTLSEGENGQVPKNLQRYLADRLPFYMLPSALLVLDEMPLTPNRKLDRRALPRPENGALSDRYLEPRNEIEARLVSIWKEVLGLERVGIRDNFFELGGHSLMAVRLFARIQEEFGQSLPLLLLFKDGTVEAIAASVTRQQESTPVNGIVPIQPEGNGVPLFILSAGLYMRGLALALGTDRPVYGLHPFENNKLVYRGSVQETARILYHCLIEFNPRGPYQLFGHSANGYFALELARLLIESGKEVVFLGLLDTYPPGARRQATVVDRMKIHLNNLQNKNFQEVLQYIGNSAERLFTRWRKQVAMDAKALERYQKQGQVKQVRSLLLRAYKPEPYEGRVILFSATHRPWFMRWDPMEQWSNTLIGQLDIVPITGDHMSMLEPPQLGQLAGAIEALLLQNETA